MVFEFGLKCLRKTEAETSKTVKVSSRGRWSNDNSSSECERVVIKLFQSQEVCALVKLEVKSISLDVKLEYEV